MRVLHEIRPAKIQITFAEWMDGSADGTVYSGLRPAETTGWFEQIGRNTRYTIHPDEILADNFVRLINGDTNVPTPQIIAAMANVFSQPTSKK